MTTDQISCGCAAWWHDVNTDKIYILLVKQWKNKDYWGIPKGRRMHNESEKHCAIRETFEETGIICSIYEKFSECTNNHGKKVVAYLAKPTYNYEINLSNPNNEVADAKWFDINELPTIQSYQKDLILSVVEKISFEATKEIRNRIFHRLEFVFKESSLEDDKSFRINSWRELKSSLTYFISKAERKMFSQTDKEYNEFEIELILMWNQLAGKKLDCDLKHI